MNNKQNAKWWVDSILFALFIVAFLLNITGLDLHQWIGIGVAVLGLYHLVTHWSWVKAVTRRLIGKTNCKSRLCYLIDAALTLGFAMMAGTGLVISSWLDLPLADYDSWRVIHILSSIGTLLVVFLKIGLHWRWIVTTAKAALTRPTVQPRKPATVRGSAQPGGARLMDRRSFLVVMGTVGITSTLALSNAVQALQLTQAPETLSDTQTITTIAYMTNNAVPTAAVAQPKLASTVASAATPTAANSMIVTSATATTTATAVPPTATAAATTIAAPVACTVLCQKGCSFPGSCRKYVDTNKNNLCDRGECM